MKNTILAQVSHLRSHTVSLGGQERPLALYIFAVMVALFHLWVNVLGTLSELWVSALHFGGFAVLCVAFFASGRQSGAERSVFLKIYDGAIIVFAILGTGYILYGENALYERGVQFITSDWIFAIITLFIAMELTKRTTGWFIPCLILIALTYVFSWGPLAPGVFAFKGLSLETTLFRSYFSSEGMFGSIARISWTYVFMFILFGAFLVKSGADQFIIDLAQVAAGRFTGGPGMVAVLSSGLMGSVSGSSVANTMSTGIITIPLMKKNGFPPKFAAGVEAAASTGGQLMPPVMGAGAFIMASYTQLSYVDIIAAATLPALLYFLSVGYFVRIEARRQGIQPNGNGGPGLLSVLGRGWHFILPMALLVWMLIEGFTPTFAAGYAILAVIAASWLKRLQGGKGMGIRDILDALALGAFNATTMAVLLVAIGLVVNVISMTGIGNTFSLMINQWAGGHLLLLLLLVAFASLILGMGLPVTAAYIVLATLSAPALYDLIAQSALLDLMATGQLPEQAKGVFMLIDPAAMTKLSQPMAMGEANSLLAQVPKDFVTSLYEQALDPQAMVAALLSAHMIIFWLSQDSNVTPPVCLTAFAAASIAGTKPMATGFMSWKLAKGLYIVPVLIAYTPLLSHDFAASLLIFIFAVPGIYALAAAIEGYAENPLNWIWRLTFLGLGVFLLWPVDMFILKVSAFIIVILAVVWNRVLGPKSHIIFG